MVRVVVCSKCGNRPGQLHQLWQESADGYGAGVPKSLTHGQRQSICSGALRPQGAKVTAKND
jgi:hypothetical protein